MEIRLEEFGKAVNALIRIKKSILKLITGKLKKLYLNKIKSKQLYFVQIKGRELSAKAPPSVVIHIFRYSSKLITRQHTTLEQSALTDVRKIIG